MHRFCGTYLDIVIVIAIIFLIVALLIGSISAINALIRVLRTPRVPGAMTEIGGLPGPGSVIDAIRGLVDALTRAPAWFALFLAGVLLFWLAGKAVGDQCRVTVQAPGAPPAAPAPAPAPPPRR